MPVGATVEIRRFTEGQRVQGKTHTDPMWVPTWVCTQGSTCPLTFGVHVGFMWASPVMSFPCVLAHVGPTAVQLYLHHKSIFCFNPAHVCLTFHDSNGPYFLRAEPEINPQFPHLLRSVLRSVPTPMWFSSIWRSKLLPLDMLCLRSLSGARSSWRSEITGEE